MTIDIRCKQLVASNVSREGGVRLPHNRTNLRDIQLMSCEVDYNALLRLVSEGSSNLLGRLSLYDIRLRHPYFNRSGPMTWQSLFAAQTTLRCTLKSCEFGRLRDEEVELWLEGGDKTIKTIARAQAVTVLSKLGAGIRTFELDS